MDGNMNKVALLIALFAAACGCPTNESGINSSSKFALSREIACGSVYGCYLEKLEEIPVYEVDSLDEVHDTCGNGNAVGCFCTSPGCTGSIIMSSQPYHIYPQCSGDTKKPSCLYMQDELALHEFLHAAYRQIGIKTIDHPPFFMETLKQARQDLIYLAPRPL